MPSGSETPHPHGIREDHMGSLGVHCHLAEPGPTSPCWDGFRGSIVESQDLSQCLDITRSFPTSCISEGHVGNSNEVPPPLPIREVSAVRSQHSHPYSAVTRNPRGEPGFPLLPGSNEVLPPLSNISRVLIKHKI